MKKFSKILIKDKISFIKEFVKDDKELKFNYISDEEIEILHYLLEVLSSKVEVG